MLNSKFDNPPPSANPLKCLSTKRHAVSAKMHISLCSDHPKRLENNWPVVDWKARRLMLTATCVILSGVQARAAPLDEPATLPRRRITSEGQDQHSSDVGPSGDEAVRSPVRCVSPEFVNAIAMNPGGRPKEVESTHSRTRVQFLLWTLACAFGLSCCCSALQRHMHSYREAFEELDGGAVNPTPTIGGEVFPQTPAFPISPQTPYFNLCKFPLWLTEGSVELNQSYCQYWKKGFYFNVWQIPTKYCISPVLIILY